MSLFSDKATHGVEYQVKPHIAWHEASLVDLTQDAKGAFQLHLTFVDDVWNPCVADPACVRNSSPPHEGNIRLEIKMRVEVWIPQTESKPASWNPATVDKVKEEFVYVTLDASRSSLIVELSHVRLPSTEITYADLTDNVSRNTIPLQKSIGSWATSDDALGCFSHICSKTGLLSMAPNPKDVKEIVLLGTDAAIRKATMLLDIHLKHQTKIADFQNSRMRQLDQLAGLKAKVENMQSVDVLVPQDSIPKIIGTSGANIKKIQDKYKVSIRILDEHIVHDRGPNGQLMKCVRILGKSMDDCVAAMSEVEYIEVRIPILEDQFGWLLGAKGVTIREFKDKSGVQTLTLERNKETILLYGSRPSVEDAQAMIDAHMLYFPVFNQMGEEIQQLNTTMDSLQYRTGGSAYGSRRDDRKGRGKERGKDWGKDWGWESDGGKPSSATQGKGKKSDYDFDDKGKKGKKSKDGKEGKDGKYSKDGKDGKGEKDDKDGKGKKGEQLYDDDDKGKGKSKNGLNKSKGAKKGKSDHGEDDDDDDDGREEEPKVKRGKKGDKREAEEEDDEEERKVAIRRGKGSHRRGAQQNQDMYRKKT